MDLLYMRFPIKLIIISRRVQGLASDLLVVFMDMDEPLASYMMVHFYVYVCKWQLVCKFSMLEIIYLLLSSCLYSYFHT